jgi:hypothetical protein
MRHRQAGARHPRFFDQNFPAGWLVLITCEDRNGKVWLSNVVVIAVPAV